MVARVSHSAYVRIRGSGDHRASTFDRSGDRTTHEASKNTGLGPACCRIERIEEMAPVSALNPVLDEPPAALEGAVKPDAVTEASAGNAAGGAIDQGGSAGQIAPGHLAEDPPGTTPANRNAPEAGQRTVKSKAELVALLRDAGLAKRAAEKIAAGGFPALMRMTDDDETVASLVEQIKHATTKIRRL